jgi:glycosyltransferase involved in cell wall biosynthesis
MHRSSVLINNYNNGRWLREAVDSVLAQTLPADEVIVYDDGSTDDSLAILRGYGGRIRLVEGIHRHDRSSIASQAAAIAGAFAVSTAEHVYLLDGDDRYKPHHLAACEARWREAGDLVMIQVAMQRIDDDGRPGTVFAEKHYAQEDYRRAIYRWNSTDFFYPTSALGFRRDFLARVLPLELPAGLTSAADIRMCWEAIFAGKIACLGTPGVDYRQHEASMSVRTGLRGLSRRRNTEMMIGEFNDFARRRGHRPLNRWLNPMYLMQLGRSCLPSRLGRALAGLKIRLRPRAAGDREGGARASAKPISPADSSS